MVMMATPEARQRRSFFSRALPSRAPPTLSRTMTSRRLGLASVEQSTKG